VKKYQADYVLVKKYPPELPEMNISIINDSCGKVLLYDESNSILFFGFSWHKYRSMNYLVINSVSNNDNIISFNKGDTIYCFNKELYLFNKKCKLFFEKETNTTHKLSGKKFVYKSKNRKLELMFVNDSICTLTNIFDCTDIEDEYKIIVQECIYIKEGNYIYLKNKELKSANGSSYIEIPPQNSKLCAFLCGENRKRPFYVGPYSATAYEKYGIIPNITTDTLRIVNNRIVLYKEYYRGSPGFIFKR